MALEESKYFDLVSQVHKSPLHAASKANQISEKSPVTSIGLGLPVSIMSLRNYANKN